MYVCVSVGGGRSDTWWLAGHGGVQGDDVLVCLGAPCVVVAPVGAVDEQAGACVGGGKDRDVVVTFNQSHPRGPSVKGWVGPSQEGCPGGGMGLLYSLMEGLEELSGCVAACLCSVG